MKFYDGKCLKYLRKKLKEAIDEYSDLTYGEIFRKLRALSGPRVEPREFAKNYAVALVGYACMARHCLNDLHFRDQAYTKNAVLLTLEQCAESYLSVCRWLFAYDLRFGIYFDGGPRGLYNELLRGVYSEKFSREQIEERNAKRKEIVMSELSELEELVDAEHQLYILGAEKDCEVPGCDALIKHCFVLIVAHIYAYSIRKEDEQWLYEKIAIMFCASYYYAIKQHLRCYKKKEDGSSEFYCYQHRGKNRELILDRPIHAYKRFAANLGLPKKAIKSCPKTMFPSLSEKIAQRDAGVIEDFIVSLVGERNYPYENVIDKLFDLTDEIAIFRIRNILRSTTYDLISLTQIRDKNGGLLDQEKIVGPIRRSIHGLLFIFYMLSAREVSSLYYDGAHRDVCKAKVNATSFIALCMADRQHNSIQNLAFYLQQVYYYTDSFHKEQGELVRYSDPADSIRSIERQLGFGVAKKKRPKDIKTIKDDYANFEIAMRCFMLPFMWQVSQYSDSDRSRPSRCRGFISDYRKLKELLCNYQEKYDLLSYYPEYTGWPGRNEIRDDLREQGRERLKEIMQQN